jgi:hypothetical protein
MRERERGREGEDDRERGRRRCDFLIYLQDKSGTD